MTICLHVVLRVSFSDCSGVIAWMKTKSRRILAGEHAADDEVKNTHVHIALEPTVTREAIRKQLINHSLGGQKHQIMEKVLKTHEPYDFIELSKYILKGFMDNLRATSLSYPETLELAKSWKRHVKHTDFGEPDDLKIDPSDNSATTEISGGTEWDKLLREYQKRKDHKEMNMREIKRWINSYYLQQKKPIPRTGDANRYSFSMWAIVNEKTQYELQELVDEHAENHGLI